MVASIKHYFSTFLLWELLKGLSLTGRYLFARKITVQFPEEKRRKAHASVACTRCAIREWQKSVALLTNSARRFARRWQSPSSQPFAMMAAVARPATTLI